MSLNQIVESIARKLNRPEKDVAAAVDKLSKNWITTLPDWHKLSATQKKDIGLPMLLHHKLDELAVATRSKREGEPCIINRGVKGISCMLRCTVYEFDYSDPIQDLDTCIGSPIQIFNSSNKPVDLVSTVAKSLIHGWKLCVNDTIHPIKLDQGLTAIDRWLVSIGLEHYINIFAQFDIDDFFVVPFLRATFLEMMGLNPNERKKVLGSVNQMQNLTPCQFVAEWIKFLGFDEKVQRTFEAKEIDLNSLLVIQEKDLADCGLEEDKLQTLANHITGYTLFSSVEETFIWLWRHGFEKYSFHFARYNIPFYALPFVNFFIINEMGVTADDQQLFSELKQLKYSPAYIAKGVAYWLRDLELERYNLAFARNQLLNLETLASLSPQDIDCLVPDSSFNRDKMKTGVQEMKEFQFYYSATACLLQELGMERYSKLFTLHGISIESLPLLSYKKLVEMGVEDEADRNKIMSVVQKIKSNIPEGAFFFVGDERVSSGLRKRKQPKGHSSKFIKPASEKQDKSVEEWLSFINTPKDLTESQSPNAQSSSSSSPSSSTSGGLFPPVRKTRKKKKKKATPQGTPTKDSFMNQAKHQGEKKETSVQSPATASRPSPSSSPSPSLPPPTCSVDSTTHEDSFSGAHRPPLISLTLEPGFMDTLPQETESKLIDTLFKDKTSEEEDDMDPELKAMLDREVEEFRVRLESGMQHTKSKLSPIFYLPD